VKASGTSQVVYVDSTGLTYNNTTNNLTTTTFTGALAGNATSATNIAGGAAASVPYQSAANNTAFLANGTAGQVLTSAGTTLAPIWSSVPIALINIIYPIGAIIQSSVSTNPGTYITGTTWIAYGAGRGLISKATSGTFATAGSTGGAETNVISVNNLPAHSHPNTLTDPGHTHGWMGASLVNAYGSVLTGPGPYTYYTGGFTTPISTNTTGITINNANNVTTATAFNILQPYIVVYTWTRTA
jgi:hypothetical protein